MPLLNPDGLEKLSTEIGDRFDFDALDLILFKITGAHVINAIAAVRDPRWQIARACLVRAEGDGTTLALLGFAVAARRADTVFREIVVAVVPQAADFQAEIKLAIPDIIRGLDWTLDQLDDPAIRNTLVGSSARLAELRRKVTKLDVYKLFHDSLHRLQMRRFASLREAASAIELGSVSDLLFDFQNQIRASVVLVTDQLDRLPWDEEDRAEQRRWITKLGTAAAGLQKAFDSGDPDLARQSLNVVKQVLDTQPTAVNGRIFSIAETLGLGDLVATLEQVAAVGQLTERARIVAAAVTLKNLQSVLIGRVREHGLWQEADDDLAPLEQHFVRPVRELITEFSIDWAALKRKFPTLWSSDPDSSWAMQLKLYQRNVDDELATLDRAAEADAVSNGDGRPSGRLMQQFASFKAEARHRFFVVDTALKADCEALLAIDPALGAIITRLNDA
ncbi:Hypothetical protein NGAL_HAMBI2605_64430 [Neorhizobium galegae bv. orientalis]|nr:Hypothetical protein NGAL_HAMBI2605_64430 [Neorhizobium galegae bv. orientalis]